MAARPEALGASIVIKSLEDVDPVLHELAWINEEQARIDALAKQRIDAIKKEYQDKCVLTIDEKQVTFDERIAALTDPLKVWLAKNIAKNLKGKKKTLDRPHGTIGLRQSPLVIELGKDTSEAKVIDAIDLAEADETETGIIASVRKWITSKLKAFGVLREDMLKVDVSLNLAGIKKAYELKRLTKEQIESVGLVVREAKDEGVVKPAKTVVSAE